MKCLLIKTQDGRSFLTQTENLPLLIEFAKTFKVEIYKVDTSDKLLTVPKLVTAICDQNYKVKPEFNNPKKIFPQKSSVSRIKADIEKQLLSMDTVQLKSLKVKYKTASYTSLCNYFSEIRRDLLRRGYKIVKTGAGSYKLN